MPPVLHIPTANDNFRLESDTSKMAAGCSLFVFQQCQWMHIVNHSKKVPHGVQNDASQS